MAVAFAKKMKSWFFGSSRSSCRLSPVVKARACFVRSVLVIKVRALEVNPAWFVMHEYERSIGVLSICTG